jgi:hypothetical protein
VLVEFRPEDFFDFFRRIFFKLSDFDPIFFLGIGFIEYSKLLMPKAKTSKTIFTIQAVETKTAIRAVMAIFKKGTIINSCAIHAFIAKFARGKMAGVHTIAALRKILRIIAILRLF